MTDANHDQEQFECYQDFRLVNIGKVCPNCERVHRMGSLMIEARCPCGNLVTFTTPEKRHVILTEIIPFSKVESDAVGR